MPGKRKETMEIREMLRQLRRGRSNRAVARALAIDRKTVATYRNWAQEQGLNLGRSPEAVAADRVAGGGKGGQSANLSEEERAAMRATAEASGMTPGGRQASAGAGQLAILAEPVIELLAQRTAG